MIRNNLELPATGVSEGGEGVFFMIYSLFEALRTLIAPRA
jgi:hypothetical protein